MARRVVLVFFAFVAARRLVTTLSCRPPVCFCFQQNAPRYFLLSRICIANALSIFLVYNFRRSHYLHTPLQGMDIVIEAIITAEY